ncbi:PhzF family phenazine biosynthesis protein [Alkalihalobacillus deserti]|uniref:PhzF family phenazine biosynthesis protein n=1 Tax=Alkalihalobacillus deserti TaxID=2879466 RepID=UPI00223DF97A|nr:PhzF family phenazine biosynthesis protein [Alkalihalobacillus deserti]
MLYTRDFAPAVGIAEDPVTGSANGALAGYLMLEGFLDDKSVHEFTIAQGHRIGRPGYVKVQTSCRKSTMIAKVGGRAVTTISGRLQVI